MENEKLGGIGASEIGGLFTSGGIKSKTAQSLALKKAIELITLEKTHITSKEMTHGIINESEAFEMVVKPNHKDAVLQSTDSYFLKDGLWATPDVVCEDRVIDIKCPYSISTYFDNINKVKNNYKYQVNLQMIATGKTDGYLTFYLTKPFNEHGDKEEYDIELHRRTKTIKVDKLDLFEKEVFDRFDQFIDLRDSIHYDLIIAEEIDDSMQMYLEETKKVTEFKKKSNLTKWGGQLVVNNGKYLVVE